MLLFANRNVHEQNSLTLGELRTWQERGFHSWLLCLYVHSLVMGLRKEENWDVGREIHSVCAVIKFSTCSILNVEA